VLVLKAVVGGTWAAGLGVMKIDDRRILLPPKIRELMSDLEKAGFRNRGGKGSHRNFVHPQVSKPVVVSGKPGDDAKRYQIKAVGKAIAESKK